MPTALPASSVILVTGNTVYAHSNSQQVGIFASGIGAEVRDNAVYDNYDGILGSKVIGNRVYHNSNIGIRASDLVQGNVVYSNGVGIRITGGPTAGRTSNNIVYANTTAGILVGAGVSKYQIVNNTVYQPVGDAVRFEGDAGIGTAGLTTDVSVRNNVLWAQAGYDLFVPASAEGGLVSDYNVFFATGTGKLGNWQGREFTDAITWFYETGQDLHSQVADPLLVNPAGPDGILGYSTAQAPTAAWTTTSTFSAGSPVIDRGDPSDAYLC